ncbi:transporter substrate-binding domain-containing protein [Vibrio sp. SCSIO 43135]|uniref:substrate-binding periplasmic protein n=1 Tax=Vibrio sp. SCSIO 43135 TaxID=2819096 RepID=UPI002074C72E|nr:transporter substrate-binding domain-containing protein [Vibrio sp. SCSIO 43135]USD42705.1 transporter substrate-binding domain-containing protein [Vibrio sp. SCSIO 43135]
MQAKSLFFLLVMLSFNAMSQDIKNVSLVCAEWPDYTNSDGTGVYWDIVREVYEPLGIQLTLRTVPWKRAQHMVKAKTADAYVGDYYDFVKHKIDYIYPKEHLSIEEHVSIIFKSGLKKEWDTLGIEMLSGKTVAWVRGYSYDTNFLSDISLKPLETNDYSQALKLLEHNRVDAVLDYQSNFKKSFAYNNPDYSIEPAKQGEKLFVVFSNSEKSVSLAKMFDDRIKLLREQGKISKIYAHYGLEPPLEFSN